MSNKTYSQSLKKKWDPLSKKITKEIMLDVDGSRFVQDNIDEDRGTFKKGFWDQKYIRKDGTVLIVESEIKNSQWFGNHGKKHPFKYPTVHIPLRKDKNAADIFFVISSCRNYAFACSKEAMMKSRVEKIPAKNPETGESKLEDFFDVPIKNGLFLVKEEKWKILKR